MSTDFIEELDALQSVYSNLSVRIVSQSGANVKQGSTEEMLSSDDYKNNPDGAGIKSSSSASVQCYYAVIQLPCSPQYNSASFVSTDVQISVPALYPATRPVFEILKSSGLCDEGRELKEQVDRFIEDSPPEECLLFQLFSMVHDFLDTCSIGECSICAEEIQEFTFQGMNFNTLIDERDNILTQVLYLLLISICMVQKELRKCEDIDNDGLM
jgi:RWD domain